MNVENELIYKALELFNIKDKIESYSTYISYFDFNRQPSEVKIIARVNYAKRNSIIIRITKEDHIDNILADKQSVFADKLRLKGINTPLKYNVNGKYVIEGDYQEHTLNFSVENYVGTHLEKLNIIRKHMELMILHKGEEKAVYEMRTHFSYYTKGFRGGSKVRENINKMHNVDKILKLVENLYLNNIEEINGKSEET